MWPTLPHTQQVASLNSHLEQLLHNGNTWHYSWLDLAFRRTCHGPCGLIFQGHGHLFVTSWPDSLPSPLPGQSRMTRNLLLTISEGLGCQQSCSTVTIPFVNVQLVQSGSLSADKSEAMEELRPSSLSATSFAMKYCWTLYNYDVQSS